MLETGARIIIAMLAIGSLTGCGNVCSSDLIGTYGVKTSPYEARLYKKDCGATTRFSYELVLKNRDNDKEALVLRFDDNGSSSWPESERTLVDLQLIRPDKLNIGLLRPVRVFKHEDRALGLRVTYDYPAGTKVM